MSFDLVSVGVVCADVMVRPVDQVPQRGTLGLVPKLEMHLGGLAAVTASAFCQLGGKAAFLGRVGKDGFGEYLLSTLRNNGVDVSGVKRVEETHSSATVVLIDSAGERTFLHHVGANAETCEDDMDFDMIRGARVFHWGGPAIMPRLDGAPMGRVFARAKALGVATSMDTCYDGKGVWLPLIEPSLPHLDIIFSSYEEACRYTGCDTPETIADFYLSRGVKIAVVKTRQRRRHVNTARNPAGCPRIAWRWLTPPAQGTLPAAVSSSDGSRDGSWRSAHVSQTRWAV